MKILTNLIDSLLHPRRSLQRMINIYKLINDLKLISHCGKIENASAADLILAIKLMEKWKKEEGNI